MSPISAAATPMPRQTPVMPTLFTSARLPSIGFITTRARLWQSTMTDCRRDWYSRSTEFISSGSTCPVKVPTPMPLSTPAAMVSGSRVERRTDR